MQKQGAQLAIHGVNSLFRGFSLKPCVDQRHLFKKSKMMAENFGPAAIARFDSGPDSIYTRIKPC